MILKEKNRKYNLVFLIDNLGWGGAERLMIPILSNIDKNKFTVRVCVLQSKNDNPVAKELKSLGIPVDTLLVPYLRDLTAFTRIKWYLKKFKAELLHAQLEFSTILGGPLAKQLGIPAVVTLHTIPSEKKNIKLRLHQFIEDTILRRFFDRVICVSEETRQFYINSTALDKKKSLVLYNGINIDSYSNPQKDRYKVLSELRIPSNAKILTTVAVLRELKGIQYMIRAMSTLLAFHPNIFYLIIGDGEYLGRLKDEVGKANVSDHVVFIGNRTDIPDLLSASDLFILPSLNEALPTVLSEAMAACLPILASKVGGIPEMVLPNVNGRLVPPANPQALAHECIQMLSDAQLLRKMGDAGRKIVEEKFNITTQINQLQDLYTELLLEKEQDNAK